MAARSGWICALVSVVAIAGCALDRAGVAVPRDGSVGRLDAGGRVDGGGALCVPGGCDDGNVCTEDVCNPEIGCVHTPVSGRCDDGVLCNGADSCANGTCSVHDGVNPCPGSTHCDVETDTCTGCVEDADCPGKMAGDWGECIFPDVCVESGRRSRVVRTFRCVAGACEPTESTETEVCSRTTDGAPCGARMVGDWSDCIGASTCAETGNQTRPVTEHYCQGGTCSGTRTTTDDRSCTRDTDGVSCGDETCSDWGPCVPDGPDECMGSGTSSRRCVRGACMDGMCGLGQAVVEERACSVSTMTCVDAVDDCGACTACMGGVGLQQCTAHVGMCMRGVGCQRNRTVPTFRRCSCAS